MFMLFYYLGAEICLVDKVCGRENILPRIWRPCYRKCNSL